MREDEPQYVLMRESLVNALAPHERGLDLPALLDAAEARSHRARFGAGAHDWARLVAADLLERGHLRARDGRVHLAPSAREAGYPFWFPALGGVTPVARNVLRSPLPWRRAHFDALREAGTRVLFSFERALPRSLAAEAGLDVRSHEWTDNGRPSIGEMDRFVAEYLAIGADVPVAMHCKAGWGRTGIAIAGALVARGASAEDALATYWSRVPDAREVMEDHGQAEFVRAWAATRG